MANMVFGCEYCGAQRDDHRVNCPNARDFQYPPKVESDLLNHLREVSNIPNYELPDIEKAAADAVKTFHDKIEFHFQHRPEMILDAPGTQMFVIKAVYKRMASDGWRYHLRLSSSIENDKFQLTGHIEWCLGNYNKTQAEFDDAMRATFKKMFLDTNKVVVVDMGDE